MVVIKEIKGYFHFENDIENEGGKPSPLVKLNRFFAPYVAKLFLYTPITGNQVSFLMIFLAFVICVLFSFGKFWYSVTGVVLLFFQIHLDYIDGLIARYKGVPSLRGVFLDLVMHSVTGPLVFMGLTVGVFKNTNSMFFLIFGMLATIFSFLATAVKDLKDEAFMIKLKRYAEGKRLYELKGKKLEIVSPEEGKSKQFLFWKRSIRYIFLYLTFIYVPFVLIFSVLFNFTQWILVFYGIAFSIRWLIILIYEFDIDYKCLEFLFKPYKPK